jgi:hypothetical protein
MSRPSALTAERNSTELPPMGQIEYLQVTSRLADLTWALRSLCSVVGRLAGRPAPSAGRMTVFPEAPWGGVPMTAPVYARAVGSHRDLIRLATVVQDMDRTVRSCAVR